MLQGVALTALWVALMRADEGLRPDRWFDDRLASAFAAAGGASDAAAIPPGASDFMAIRTRFFDDQVLAADLRQVVLLGVGLDSRAFRLDWPDGVRLFELDLPDLFAFKEPVVADSGEVARCERILVRADLREDWLRPLEAAGFDASVPTAWVAEGLLPYLAAEDNDRLLVVIDVASAPGSTLAFDHLDGGAADRAAMRDTAGAVRSMGTELISTVADPTAWLAGHGWRSEVFRVPKLGEDYGRPLPDFVDLAASNATALVSARR